MKTLQINPKKTFDKFSLLKTNLVWFTCSKYDLAGLVSNWIQLRTKRSLHQEVQNAYPDLSRLRLQSNPEVSL